MQRIFCILLAITLVAQCFGFTGEYRDMMSNCRLDGGYCFNPAAARASAEPGEAAEGAPPTTAAPVVGRGRRRGPNPLGRANIPPPMTFQTEMNLMNQQCRSTDFDLGCMTQGGNGMCCYPFL